MSILIRKALPDDCYAIADIIKHSLGYDNSPALIRNNLENLAESDSDLVLIAEYNGHPVGLVHAEDYNSLYAPPQKDLMSLAVKKEYQHLKIGTALMEQVEKWAKETGRCGIRVLSQEKLTGAHGFYKHLGYEYIKTQFNFEKYF
ncbi:MAG: GNAT family N-acetyltransferase [Ruminococcaceae bacterium]|nr:GNAT family N-acetyltransferase [Oscillospiraceae bacterium]